MKVKLQKTIALILTLILTISCLPFSVYAREIQWPTKINGDSYNPLYALSFESSDDIFTINTKVAGESFPFYLRFPSCGGIRLFSDKTGFWENDEYCKITYSGNASDGLILDSNNGTKVLFTLNGDKTWQINVYNSSLDSVFLLTGADISIGFTTGKVSNVSLSKSIAKDEIFYGLGERFNSFSQTGHKILLWNTDPFDDLMDDDGSHLNSYINIPLLNSTSGYMLYFNSTYAATADMGYSNKDRYYLNFNGPIFDFYLWTGTPLENIRSYTSLTGTSVLPPKWAFSFLAGNGQQVWNADGTEPENYLSVLKDYLKRYEELGTPVSALYGELGVVTDKAAYEITNSYGTRTLGWTNSCMTQSELASFLPGISSRSYPYVRRASNPSLMMDGTDPYIDFTNPLSKLALYNKFSDLWESGLRGCMVDYADNVYEDTLFYNGKTGDEMHNLYPYYYDKAVYAAWDKALDGDFLLFARSAAVGSQAYVANFEGDLPSTYQGLRMALNAGLSMSASGYSIWGSAIGGHGPIRTYPTADLYMRWMQFGAFSPLMRTHGMTNRGPWIYGKEAENNFIKYYWLRKNLLNYIYSNAIKSNLYGTPVMQAMAMAFPDDEEILSVDDEYMFGDDLLVCPILSAQSYERTVKFPNGRWTDFWSGKVYEGGSSVNVSAPQDRIPVFIKSGAMIPLKVSESLEIADPIKNKSGIEAFMVTAPTEKRTVEYYTDSQEEYNFTSFIGKSGLYNYQVAEGSRAEIVFLAGIKADFVLIDNVQLHRLDKIPAVGTEGYFIDYKNNRTVVSTGKDKWNVLQVLPSGSNEVICNFDTEDEISVFTDYYADNAKCGYTEFEAGTNWKIENGKLVRTLPDGMDYWWSNLNSGKPLANTIEYGLAANLVYTGSAYTDFVLEVDIKRASTITRPTAVGFGEKPGRFFVNTDLQMNSDGGVYAYINRSGETALWGYLEETVNGANGKLANNGRILGANVGGAPGTWNHLKLVVRDSAVAMYVDGNLVTSSKLKNYSGGYISLFTSGDGAFDNLKITTLCNSVAEIEQPENIVVEKGTEIETFLPQNLKVTYSDGVEGTAEVVWKTDGCNAEAESVYELSGILKGLPARYDNAGVLIPKITVAVKNTAEAENRTERIVFSQKTPELMLDYKGDIINFDNILPQKIYVTGENGTVAECGVVWDTEAFSPERTGKYEFEGRLTDIPAYLTDYYHLSVSVTLTYMSETKSEEVTEIDFNGENSFNGFSSYYAANVLEGFTKGEIGENWSITEDGKLLRILPSTVSAWWNSNSDVYKNYNVGEKEYGIVANLVYTEKIYTDFELEADVKCVSGISRSTAIGFGEKEGRFFVDSDNRTDNGGGTYFEIQRDGTTAIWGNVKSGSTATGNLKLTGSSVPGGNDVWNHVKITVKSGAVTVYVNGVEIFRNINLNNYSGGYISLMTSANGGFDNLIIRDCSDATIQSVENIDIQYADGECAGEINFPNELTVTGADGSRAEAGVEWNCKGGFHPEINGKYHFVGVLKNIPEGYNNAKGIVAEAAVIVDNQGYDDRKVIFNFDSTADLSSFTAYYAANARNGYDKSEINLNWKRNSKGYLERILPAGATGWWNSNTDVYQDYGVGEKEYGMVANLLYEKRKYRNFELEVDVRRISSISRPVCIGFGQSPGNFFVDGKNMMDSYGGAYFEIQGDGTTSLWGYSSDTVASGNSNVINNARIMGDKAAESVNGWDHIKLRIVDNTFTALVNGNTVLSNINLTDYYGGYLSLMTSADGAFDNLVITDLTHQMAENDTLYLREKRMGGYTEISVYAERECGKMESALEYSAHDYEYVSAACEGGFAEQGTNAGVLSIEISGTGIGDRITVLFKNLSNSRKIFGLNGKIYGINGNEMPFTVKNIVYGDINSDGIADIKDLVRLKKYFAIGETVPVQRASMESSVELGSALGIGNLSRYLIEYS